MGIFSKKSGSATTIYGPLTPCYVSEKNNEPIPRKLVDRRKDRQMDRPYFIGPFQARLGAQKACFAWLRKRLYFSRLMLDNLTKLTKILARKIQCNRFCFISFGVQAVFRFLVSIKNLKKLKKLPWNKFVKKKKCFSKNFVVCKIFQNYKKFLVDDLADFLAFINVYQCFFTLSVLFDAVDRGLFVRYHLYCVLKKTLTDDQN